MKKIRKTKKEADKPIRNKELTKKKLIDSFGELIEKEGFSFINHMRVARAAGCDKKLIYEYFGNISGLAKEYLKERNFCEKLFSGSNRTGKDTSYQRLKNQFDRLMKDGEMRGVIAWELAEELPLLKEQAQTRENLIEKAFENKDENNRAIEAVLMSSIYYLTIHSHTNETSFLGIDLKQEEGQQQIKRAIKQIVEWAYK